MKLRELPPPDRITKTGFGYHSAAYIRLLRIEAAQDALEEAARVCDYWTEQNHMYVNGALRCGRDIRAIPLEQP